MGHGRAVGRRDLIHHTGSSFIEEEGHVFLRDLKKSGKEWCQYIRFYKWRRISVNHK